MPISRTRTHRHRRPDTGTVNTPTAETASLIASACQRIAPAWPLHRSIAVNPYWGWIERPIAEAAAAFGSVTGGTLTMPREWFREQHRAGRVADADILRAIERSGASLTVEEVRTALADEAVLPRSFPLWTDTRDVMYAERHNATCQEVMLAQIGRVAEVFFDAGEAAWRPDRSSGLYGLWRAMARVDRSPELLVGITQLGTHIDDLPSDAAALVEGALGVLPVPPAHRETYLTALLFSVSGWASVAAQHRWEARQLSSDDSTMVDLLAIRLTWELAACGGADGAEITQSWRQACRDWEKATPSLQQAQVVDWVLQQAVESRYHEQLARALITVPVQRDWTTGPTAMATVRAQAVFCIDVRSEPMRRALEDADPDVRTLGFAGFFGLPMTFTDSAGETRAQLPGLLTPTLAVHEIARDAHQHKRRVDLGSSVDTAWNTFSRGAPSAFAAIESLGIASAAALVRDAFAGPEPIASTPPSAPRSLPELRPMLVADQNGGALTVEHRATLAASILRGMSLTAGFAPLVAFIGHGVRLTNNPQSAALACGACGGHSGEMNARAAATLLNDPAVRRALVPLGITIPEGTHFVAGLHDTTTDVVQLFADSEIPAERRDGWEALSRSLTLAGDRCRAERSKDLGVESASHGAVRDALAQRAADWAETRPEWGLARNGVFVAAPRPRTMPFNLRGRAFLHEYIWQRDAGYSVLETILTAPVIVAHWINLQYYASVVDPERFGSGDKTLHNVAGGNVGVYEGAGGDLRIGLARQSVHDGTSWHHEPLRLAVYVEAPPLAIDAVIAKHLVLRQLVEHQWLHLFVIAPDGSGVRRRRSDRWEAVSDSPRAVAIAE
jgi:uncharacterized protein